MARAPDTRAVPIASLVAALIGAAIAAVAVGEQWRLYREEQFRNERASGQRLLIMRVLAAAAAAITLGLAWREDHHETGAALATSLFLLVLVVLASTDFERKRLPNLLTYPAILLAAALCWAWPERSVLDVAFGAVAAVLIGIAVFLFGALVGGASGARGVIPFGIGDVKLMFLMGLLCGWPALVSALFIGAVIAGIPSIAMIVRGQKRTAIAYGPYLAIGCMVVLLFPGQFV